MGASEGLGKRYHWALIESGTPHSLRTRKAEPRLAGVPLFKLYRVRWPVSGLVAYGRYCSTIDVMMSPSCVYQTHRPPEYHLVEPESLYTAAYSAGVIRSRPG